MAEEGQDFNSNVECLVNMFGSVLNRDAIISIVESCEGDLSFAADAIMKITNDSPEGDANRSSVASGPDLGPQNSSENMASNSYSTAMKTGRFQESVERQNRGAVPKICDSPKDQSSDQLKRIAEYHRQGSRVLIIMRGVPGSGKTHLAHSVVKMIVGANVSKMPTHIYSTDDFFMVQGSYQFDRQNLSQAHLLNQKVVNHAMIQGLSPIVVDNTNIEYWEMEPYVRGGVDNGYIIEVLEPNTPWAKKASLLARKNVHGVPFSTIRRMLDSFVPGITGAMLMQYFKLQYSPDRKPPILRTIPVFHPINEPMQNEGPASTRLHMERSYNSVNTPVPGKHNGIANSSEQISKLSNTACNTDFIQKNDLNKVTKQDNYVDNTFQRQLDEIQKVELDWDNGECWDESRQQASGSNDKSVKDNTLNPKPQRTSSPKAQKSNENVLNAIGSCKDWRQISLFLPSWEDNTPQSKVTEANIIDTKSTGTCMEIGDFDKNKLTLKILTGTARNINEHHISFERDKIPDRPKLDKSTTTTEMSISGNTVCENVESHFVSLKRIFPKVNKMALRDILDQCRGDVNWAMEILLDSWALNQFDTGGEEVVEDEASNVEFSACTCLSAYNIIPNISEEPKPLKPVDLETITPAESTLMVAKKSKREVNPSDASLQLKRQIEQNFVIADNHYSKHCLKLKKWRHGEYISDEETDSKVDEPSTSRGNVGAQFDPETNEEESSDEDDMVVGMENLEKTVNVNLGREFVAELDALFGRSDMTYPDNLMTKINIPVSLLNEINALWMESLMHQLDEHERLAAKMIQEDAEYARILTMKEAEFAEKGKPPEILDFKEIMDMDYALSLYQRDVREWKAKEPNDIAAKLSREKLYNLFPDVCKDILSELLVAHDNNFQATVEGLLVSTGKANILQENNGLNNFITQKEMEMKMKVLEQERKALSETEWPLLTKGEVPDMETVKEYRETANRHLNNRNANFRKATDFIYRGMLGVGGYYRELAEFHKMKYEQCNSLAASSLMQIHAAKNPDADTIDLHFLYVAEAKETLDLFIDSHITRLKETGKKNISLFFITGRGLHSNGRPKVKPAVKKRLLQRGLAWKEVNPGLLSSRISSYDKLTHQLPHI